jgi:hypothetical protein
MFVLECRAGRAPGNAAPAALDFGRPDDTRPHPQSPAFEQDVGEQWRRMIFFGVFSPNQVT